MRAISAARTDGTEKGAAQPNKWSDRRLLALFLRVLVFVGPIAVSVVFVAAASRVLDRPTAWWGTALWWACLTIASTAVLTVTERLMRKFLPLVALFRLSLVFPDHAPSRFKVAMRTNTLRQLQRSLEQGEVVGEPDFQEAAEKLVALAGALNAHDRMTRGHTERVRAFSLMIGEELRLPKDDLDRLHWAGLVHDIGKLEVPPAILNKAGRPSDDEWATLQRHPEAGLRLVEPLRPWLGEWADAASQHHERWDGTGYPFGLSGEQISLSGRIVAVADAYDVMTSVRSYKKAMTPEAARAELLRCAGTQFDATVVRAFLNISVGRLRFVMGPLSWLAQAPALGNVPIGAAAITAASSLTSIAIAITTGLATTDPPIAAPPAAATVAFVEVIAPFVSLTGLEDQPLVFGLSSVSGPAPSTLELTEVPEHLRLQPGSDELVLVPETNWSGHTEGRYRGCWDDDQCATSTVSVDVAPLNDPPVPMADGASTPKNTSVVIDVLANDIDVEDGRPALSSIVEDSVMDGARASVSANDEIVFDPPADFVGTAHLQYRATDDDGAVASGSVTIDVTPVNTPPEPGDDSVTAAAGSTTEIDVLDNDTDAENDALTIVAVTPPTFGQVILDPDRVTYRAPDGTTRTTSFTYTVEDAHGARGQATVDVSIVADDPVSPPPGLPQAPAVARPTARDDAATITEDAASAVVDVTANDTSADGDLSDDLLAVVTPPQLGTASVVDGQLVYQPDRDANGIDALEYRICETTGSCATALVTMSVRPINDPPQFVDGGDVSRLEDSGATVVNGWATAITTGASNESAQNIGFTVTVDRPAMFTTLPAVDASGTLRFQLAPDASGVARIRTTAVDDGGTSDGGIDTSAAHNATIEVSAVNDSPRFVGGGNLLAVEDSGPVIVANWATTIAAGPADEAGQSVSFTVDVDRPALFSVAPAIDAAGTLRFTSAPDANGVAVLTVTAADDGGGSNGGIPTSSDQTAAVTIVAVNDRPQFADTGDVAVSEDAGVTSITGWASAISTGPADESVQSVVFTVVADQPNLFSAQPAINGSGLLTFTPAPDANGSATLTVTAADGGGTAHGGIDTSVTHTATVTVGPVNDPVVALDDSPATTEDDAAGVTFDVLANDTDADADMLVVATFDATTLVGGSLVDNGGGSFTYVPEPNFNGTDSFTYTAGDGNGSTDIATVTVVIGPQPDAPAATADAYATAESTPRAVAAPGVLNNDYDEDGDALSISTTPTVAPAHGIVALSADGGFTYTPTVGFVGADSFSYALTDATGATATGTVSIVVDSGTSSGGLYLGTTSTLGIWNMTTVAPVGAPNPEPDHDSDGDPGLTVAKNGLFDTETWTRTIAGTALDLNGPVTLELWSTIEDFRTDKDGHPEVTLLDCNSLGLGCVTVSSTSTHMTDYNGNVANWVRVDVQLGSVTHTFPVGRQLRLQIQSKHEDLWIAATGTRPSRLTYTLANTAPTAVNDTAAATIEDAATATNIAVLVNDTDNNIDPASITIISAPSKGAATPRVNGTVDYQPNADANGADSFTYRVCDTSGLCDTATVSITVAAVNDAPSFLAGSDISINATDPTFAQAGWATNITPGPSNESGQSVTFTVTAADPSLFSVQPSLDAAGTLTFVPSGSLGSTTITIGLGDNGGTANGGSNASGTQTATITLN